MCSMRRHARPGRICWDSGSENKVQPPAETRKQNPWPFYEILSRKQNHQNENHQKQNHKKKNGFCFGFGSCWILVFSDFGFCFWILDFGFCFCWLGSRDETGDEIEDPNDSLTIRTPFTGLRPDQNLRQSKSPKIFCSKYFGGFWFVGDFGQNHPSKIPREEESRITGGSRILPRGFASKSSWTKIL